MVVLLVVVGLALVVMGQGYVDIEGEGDGLEGGYLEKQSSLEHVLDCDQQYEEILSHQPENSQQFILSGNWALEKQAGI